MSRSAGNDTTRLDPAQAAFFESRVQPILKARCHQVPRRRGEGSGQFPRGQPRGRAARRRPGTGHHTRAGPRKVCYSRRFIMTAWRCRPPAGSLARRLMSLRAGSRKAWPGRRPIAPERFRPRSRPLPLPASRRRGGPTAGRSPRTARGRETQAGSAIRSTPCYWPGSKSEGLEPAPPAERVALIRRLTYDLTGLPPTPEEVDAFVADPAADAYERLVDRLLASPHYGEKPGAGTGSIWFATPRPTATNATRQAQRLALSRLRHRGLQSGQALRSIHPRAACRRRDRPDRGRGDDRHRLLPTGPLGR